MTEKRRCIRLEGPHLMPGWGCCKCNTYNGIQRIKCKVCRHSPCYTEIDVEEVEDGNIVSES